MGTGVDINGGGQVYKIYKTLQQIDRKHLNIRRSVPTIHLTERLDSNATLILRLLHEETWICRERGESNGIVGEEPEENPSRSLLEGGVCAGVSWVLSAQPSIALCNSLLEPGDPEAPPGEVGKCHPAGTPELPAWSWVWGPPWGPDPSPHPLRRWDSPKPGMFHMGMAPSRTGRNLRHKREGSERSPCPHHQTQPLLSCPCLQSWACSAP